MKQERMARAQILVIGHNDNGCTPEHQAIAYEVGMLVAQRGAVLVTGGLGGVMRAACKGAWDQGGITLGILPQNCPDPANEFCRVVVPTGLGLMRDFVNVYAADGIIIVGGGSGTLSEMCAAYMHNRPMVAIRGTGGMADRYVGECIDHRNTMIIDGADTAREAVSQILKTILP